MTQTRSAVVFTNSSTGPSPLLANALRQTGIVAVLPHQLPGSSNGISLIIIERQLERAETICINLRKYQEYAQMPILVLADTVDPSRLPRFKELKAVVLPPPLTEAAVREFLAKRMSELNAAEGKEGAPPPPPVADTKASAPKQPDAPKREEAPPQKDEPPPRKAEPAATAESGTHTATPPPKDRPPVTPRPDAGSEPSPRPPVAKEVKKVVRPERDREDEIPTSTQLLKGQPDTSVLPSESVRCGHCPRWHVRREDAFCSRCGSPLIVLKMSPTTLAFEPRGSHTVGQHVRLHNVGQNPLWMVFGINASGELADRLSISAPAWVLTGDTSGDLLVKLDARGLDLSGSYEAALEIVTNEGPNVRHLIPISVERLPRPRVIKSGEYIYSLNELHQPNRWEFGLANDGGRTLRLQHVMLTLHGVGEIGLELVGPAPVTVSGGQTVEVGVRLPDLELLPGSYSGKLTFLFDQSDPVSFDINFKAKRPRYLAVKPADFIDFGEISTRSPEPFTLALLNLSDADSLTVESVELPDSPWASFRGKFAFPVEIAAGTSLLLDLWLDGSRVVPNIYEGELVVRSNSYRKPLLRIPFSVEFKEPKVFDGYMGIDFGTTASCVAVLDKRDLRPISIDQYGAVSEAEGIIMPSVLYFQPDGTVLAGREAQVPASNDATNAVHAIKRALGSRSKLRKAGRDYEPTELAALVIEELCKRAGQALFKVGEFGPPRCAVLTVPVDFTEKQRRALLEASTQAGLDNFALADHPTVLDEALAVALYYQRRRAEARPASGDAERVLVFDFGGGTLDCGLIEIRYSNQKTTFKTLATYGDSHLGGEDIDWALVEVLAEEASKEYPDLDRRCLEKPVKLGRMQRLYRNSQLRYAADRMRVAFKEGAEQAKIKLCSEAEASVRVTPLLREGALPGDERVMREGKAATFETVLRQEDFERVLKPFVDRALRVVEVLCARAGVAPADVSTILHAGRSSLIPTIKRRVKEFLPNATDRTDLIEPKVCVALGAAHYGRLKTYPTERFEIIGGANHVAHDLGYIDLDQDSDAEVFIPVITAQTPFPTEREVKMRWGGRVVHLQVAENRGVGNSLGDNPDVVYGDVVSIDARQSEQEEISLLFKVNEDGLLEVSVDGKVQRIIDISE